MGYEFAARFAKEGYNIIAVARNKQKLDELKHQLEKTYGIAAWIYNKDLSDQNEVRDLYEALKNEQLDVHILVNNAGFRLYGEFVET
ncbi:SDR family NAD(P)-dependent oxidoreductase [Anoxybacillus sp.]|uniref:SDR family NAD(P)-dependent oxidoreductase n=1 Tax=Anoxybacillus sp. TaxID=1872573 RepID=UPI003FA595B0